MVPFGDKNFKKLLHFAFFHYTLSENTPSQNTESHHPAQSMYYSCLDLDFDDDLLPTFQDLNIFLENYILVMAGALSQYEVINPPGLTDFFQKYNGVRISNTPDTRDGCYSLQLMPTDSLYVLKLLTTSPYTQVFSYVSYISFYEDKLDVFLNNILGDTTPSIFINWDPSISAVGIIKTVDNSFVVVPAPPIQTAAYHIWKILKGLNNTIDALEPALIIDDVTGDLTIHFPEILGINIDNYELNTEINNYILTFPSINDAPLYYCSVTENITLKTRDGLCAFTSDTERNYIWDNIQLYQLRGYMTRMTT
jgi:hypothetical protein